MPVARRHRMLQADTDMEWPVHTRSLGGVQHHRYGGDGGTTYGDSQPLFRDIIYSAQLFIIICLAAYLILITCRLYCSLTTEGFAAIWDAEAWRVTWEQTRACLGWESTPDWEQVE
jgi:hypothetical protein